MKNPKLIIGLLVLGLVAFWGYRKFFPPDEVVIRKFLTRAAETASIPPNESGLNKITAVKWLVNACTPDFELSYDAPDGPIRSVQGREQLGEVVGAVRATAQSLSIELLDIGVEVDPDRSSAVAQFIARVRLDSAQDPIVQEFKAKLRRVDGDWRFQSIEALSSLKM